MGMVFQKNNESSVATFVSTIQTRKLVGNKNMTLNFKRSRDGHLCLKILYDRFEIMITQLNQLEGHVNYAYVRYNLNSVIAIRYLLKV